VIYPILQQIQGGAATGILGPSVMQYAAVAVGLQAALSACRLQL
jgi:hypothetical protein